MPRKFRGWTRIAVLLVLVLAGSVAGASTVGGDPASDRLVGASHRQAVAAAAAPAHRPASHSAAHRAARPEAHLAARPARTGKPPEAQCSDGIDNKDREDTLADAEDPGCHSDGDANNAGSYDPGRRTEQDRGPSRPPEPTPSPSPTPTPTPTPTPDPEPKCSASVVRIGEVEPLAANPGEGPCRSAFVSVVPPFEFPQGDGRIVRLTGPHAGADQTGSFVSVAHFDLFDPTAADPDAFPLVHAELLSASTGCGGKSGPNGGSKVAQLWIGPVLVEPVGPGPQVFEAGPLATVYTNQTIQDGRSVTVRALFIDTHGPLEDLVGDIAVAEASYEEPPSPPFECLAAGSRGH